MDTKLKTKLKQNSNITRLILLAAHQRLSSGMLLHDYLPQHQNNAFQERYYPYKALEMFLVHQLN